MPVERQAERLATPLSKRDRRFLAISGAVAALVILGGVLYLVFGYESNSGKGCFTAIYPSSMGGATVHHCGDAAVQYCRADAGIQQIADACRRAGLAVGSKP
jgi:hypothetical protein